jgi:hypothetical protein
LDETALMIRSLFQPRAKPMPSAPQFLQTSCPNCSAQQMEELYSVETIPVHSTIQLADHDKASKFPTGDLTFAYCHACGFLSNTRYDASVQEYCTNCEESQHVSPTFDSFARQLAHRWIERYNIRDRQIIEVGCGKGEFLALMCEMGNNRGIGIDPSHQPGRNLSAAASRMRFINDLYSEKYTSLPADVILCRHTLEHIGQTRQFMQMIRRAIGDRYDMLVLFELPDVTRVLRERAFWDVYYEHCSYFSPGSLARLFRSTGFELLELGRDYGDQYLLISARPANRPTLAAFPLEDDLTQMRDLAMHFKTDVTACIAAWRQQILSMHAAGKKVVIWSALSKAVAFLTTLKVGNAIEYAVDINPQRHGKFLPITAQEIKPPAFLEAYKPDVVILMNPIYVAEVQRDLDRMGLKAAILPVGT